MSDEKEVFHRRVFLNDHEGMAALEADVTNRSWGNDGKRHVSIDGNFTVSDEESLDRVVRKLNRLIHAAEDVRDALVKEARREGLKRK